MAAPLLPSQEASTGLCLRERLPCGSCDLCPIVKLLVWVWHSTGQSHGIDAHPPGAGGAVLHLAVIGSYTELVMVIQEVLGARDTCLELDWFREDEARVLLAVAVFRILTKH